MSRTRLLVAAALSAAAGSLPSAQCPSVPYGHNWAPMHQPVTAGNGLIFAGPKLFQSSGGKNYASPGDAIRVCYGIDSTQGGRNHLPGKQYEVTSLRVAQGFAPANTIPGVDIGTVSVMTASDSDLGGDACFAPFFASTGNTGGHHVGATMNVGLISGTAGAAFPTMWDVKLSFVGGTGASGPVTIGTDPSSIHGNPLLANLILEIGGPTTGGPTNNQYYMASLDEVTGVGASGLGTGGVTNGNRQWGSSIFGNTADVTGAISHSRILSDLGGGLVAGSIVPHLTPGRAEMVAQVAFRTPVLWAINNDNSGAGGPDWTVSQSPVSVVDMRYLDQLSGAETTTDILWKTGGGGPPASAFDPCLAFNRAFFLWSATSACDMQQMPLSWDDLGCVVPAQCGSIILGPQVVSRTAPLPETVPINFDALTVTCLSNPGITIGTPFSPSDDPCLDAVGPDSSFCEGVFEPIVSGISTRSGGPAPAVNNPMPNLRGLRLGAAAMGLQLDACTGILRITEFGNGVTLVLQ